VRTETGCDQIADAAQSVEGAGVPTHDRSQAQQLSQTSRDQRSFGIIAKAEAIADSSGQREYILKRAA
jgi:hypothetical protein